MENILPRHVFLALQLQFTLRTGSAYSLTIVRTLSENPRLFNRRDENASNSIQEFLSDFMVCYMYERKSYSLPHIRM